ncbi:3-hydroxyanthranilate 3,4-dioxygenase [Polytolypa hystricis UAMH7299]|uniref:3-hydroxyanthranilate 3,4-dioxygenase n=1 Tax=Polytolypa hystricis (strain UAMH7299) TaxID=1447883 RepID=A0A2B7WXN3_POLH7|nr:3-hydroxyanthranilate 3,4-dioxygenase [Polytolypa hystricis UAMH7299]
MVRTIDLDPLSENAHLLQPPVSNHCVYHPSSPHTPGYTVMIVGGPNARTDYHINPTPEFFYQHTGSMLLRVVTDESTSPHTFEDIPIHEGSMFLLPPNTPHCPVRFAGSVGIVVEMPRGEGGEDRMRWYCGGCGGVVWEKRFLCVDLGTQVREVVEEFGGDEGKRRCGGCGVVVGMTWAEGEVRQPPRFPE